MGVSKAASQKNTVLQNLNRPIRFFNDYLQPEDEETKLSEILELPEHVQGVRQPSTVNESELVRREIQGLYSIDEDSIQNPKHEGLLFSDHSSDSMNH